MVPAALGGNMTLCSMSVFSLTVPKISPPEIWLPAWETRQWRASLAYTVANTKHQRQSPRDADADTRIHTVLQQPAKLSNVQKCSCKRHIHAQIFYQIFYPTKGQMLPEVKFTRVWQILQRGRSFWRVFLFTGGQILLQRRSYWRALSIIANKLVTDISN